MELDLNFFEKLGKVTKATADPHLRLERELGLAWLWKKFGPRETQQDSSIEGTIAEMRRNVAASVAACKRVVERIEKSHAAAFFAPLAGSGRAEHLRATDSSKLNELDTRRAAFQPQTVTVQPGESFQSAMLRAARENRETSELKTSPAQPWPPADRRDRSSQAAKVATGDELIKAASAAARDGVKPLLERYHGRRISEAGSLECTMCGGKFFAMEFGPRPLQRLEKHFRDRHSAESVPVGTSQTHELSKATTGNRNF